MTKLRVAIIGAGPSGLSQLLAFKQVEQEQQVEVVCFEKQSDWGGLWLYTSQIGIDANGETIHSSMYRHLWSNNPKELIEFPDYTYYDHFGCHLPSYLPRPAMFDYITGRAKVNNLRRFIRFNTAVHHVDFDDKKNEFNVDVEDFNTNSTERLHFDRVIVASGHHDTPNMINIDGVDQFLGRVLHSHDFRGADEFVGRNLLVIGGSFSGDDISLQCYKFGAQSVTISSRQDPIPYKWPSEIKTAPMLVRMEGRTAHFKDGSTVGNIDAIIFCTGYRHHYPFMAKHLRLHSGIAQFIPPNLYKSVFWVDQPNLAYLGAPRQFYSFPMFELQTALVRDVFLGHIKLPNKEQWQTDIDKWQTRENSIGPAEYFAMIDFQTDYLREILALLRTYDNDPIMSQFDLEKATHIFKKFFESKLADILHYRDQSFESFIDTKNKSTVKVVKPWIKNMDDSIENILNDYRKK